MTLLSHHISHHLEWFRSTDKSHNLATDIKALWETIFADRVRRYSPRQNDTSIGNSLYDDLHTPPILVPFGRVDEQIPAGRVIWIVPAVSLQQAIWMGRGMGWEDAKLRTLAKSPGHLLAVLLNNVHRLSNSYTVDIDVDRYYSHAHQWTNPLDCFPAQLGGGYPLIVSDPNTPTAQPQPTQLFLTDMLFSGITVSGVELGHYAKSQSIPAK
jgi:hypothetical protein